MPTDLPQPLPLAGDRVRALRWLAVFLLAVPGALLLIASGAELAHGVPLQVAGIALLGPLVLLQGLFLLFAWRIRDAGVALSARALGIDTGVARRIVPLAALAARGVRVVNLAERSDLRPLLRTWGIGLPGLQAGWYRLRDGSKALCLVTERQRVCLLEDDRGLRYLLSITDPAPLQRALALTPRR